MARYTPKTPLSERIINANVLASKWLADGNEASEIGDKIMAEFCYKKSSYWRDRFNLLTNSSDRAAPTE